MYLKLLRGPQGGGSVVLWNGLRRLLLSATLCVFHVIWLSFVYIGTYAHIKTYTYNQEHTHT